MNTILVVDDEAIVLEVVSDYLRKEGFTVVTAADGEEALLRFQESRPDLILLDLMLPRIDGIEVCRRIRSTSNVPIIMVTTEAEKSRVIEAIKAGVNNYVVKPFTGDTLQEKINQTLSKTEAPA